MSDRAIDRAERLAAELDADALPDDAGIGFDAPWQARAFGLAVALDEHVPAFDWSAFQARFVERLNEMDPDTLQADVESVYYEQWLESLEATLVDTGSLSVEAIDGRQHAFGTGERDASEFVLEDGS